MMTSMLTTSRVRILAIIFSLLMALGEIHAMSAVEDSTRDSSSEIGALFSSSSKLKARNWTWGAETGSSVDLTSHNLTTFDINLNAGYRNSFFRIIGIGFGIQRSIGSGNTFVPVYAVMSTSFRNKPSRFFFNLKTGYSFNTLSSSKSKGGYQLSAAGGIVLTNTKIMSSYLMLGYGFYHINKQTIADLQLDISHVDFAQIILGISF